MATDLLSVRREDNFSLHSSFFLQQFSQTQTTTLYNNTLLVHYLALLGTMSGRKHSGDDDDEVTVIRSADGKTSKVCIPLHVT